MNIGQSSGKPIGVMPPYSMPDADTATSIEANEILLDVEQSGAPVPFTSARVVARTTHAANVVTSPRRPATTTQFADCRGQHAVALAERGGVGEGRIDLGDRDGGRQIRWQRAQCTCTQRLTEQIEVFQCRQ